MEVLFPLHLRENHRGLFHNFGHFFKRKSIIFTSWAGIYYYKTTKSRSMHLHAFSWAPSWEMHSYSETSIFGEMLGSTMALDDVNEPNRPYLPIAKHRRKNMGKHRGMRKHPVQLAHHPGFSDLLLLVLRISGGHRDCCESRSMGTSLTLAQPSTRFHWQNWNCHPDKWPK